MKDIHPNLVKKLEKFKTEYQQVTAFAKLLPLFANRIIDSEFTGDRHCRLGSHYKQINFSWHIDWYVNRPTNFPEDEQFHEGLVNVYINCLTLFHEDIYHLAQKELWEAMKDIPCYYTDVLNSTFYFKPDEIEAGLEALNNWYIKVKDSTQDYLKEQKRKQLQAQLQELDK
jgi:hypothetical protein